MNLQHLKQQIESEHPVRVLDIDDYDSNILGIYISVAPTDDAAKDALNRQAVCKSVKKTAKFAIDRERSIRVTAVRSYQPVNRNTLKQEALITDSGAHLLLTEFAGKGIEPPMTQIDYSLTKHNFGPERLRVAHNDALRECRRRAPQTPLILLVPFTDPCRIWLRGYEVKLPPERDTNLLWIAGAMYRLLGFADDELALFSEGQINQVSPLQRLQ